MKAPQSLMKKGYKAQLVKAAARDRRGPSMPSSKAKSHPEDNFYTTCTRLEKFGSPQTALTRRLICCNMIKQRKNRFILVQMSQRAEVRILAK